MFGRSTHNLNERVSGCLAPRVDGSGGGAWRWRPKLTVSYQVLPKQDWFSTQQLVSGSSLHATEPSGYRPETNPLGVGGAMRGVDGVSRAAMFATDAGSGSGPDLAAL